MTRQWMRPGLGLTSIAPALLLVAVSQVSAQQPAAPAQGQAVGLSQGLKRSWDGFKVNLSEAAEKMPDENYSFKPTPDVRSFAELISHVSASLYGTCAAVKGETMPVSRDTITKQTAKADLVKTIQGGIAYCDGVYGTATDESLVQPVKAGQSTVISVNLLWYNISHTNEHYGNMATYMRLKGLVPPSTERSQKPKPSAN